MLIEDLDIESLKIILPVNPKSLVSPRVSILSLGTLVERFSVYLG